MGQSAGVCAGDYLNATNGREWQFLISRWTESSYARPDSPIFWALGGTKKGNMVGMLPFLFICNVSERKLS
jgi:hypothetical protein